ncbi:MAG: XRE family transcriptional regulator [Paramuribaculum sp.]|nr:XRE family transcriptional regulator [Paramuribaculum sp.]
MNNQIADIFSQRLRQARLMRGFSLEKLSQALENTVTRQAINKYEKGLMKPDSHVLIALAKALNVKVDYFFRPFSVEVGRVEFRRKSGFTEKMAAAVKARVREELERYLEIEQLSTNAVDFTLPRKNVADELTAKQFAREVRGFLKLGNDGISNVIEVLEDSGIKVIELFENEEFDGLSGYVDGTIPLIVVNGNLSAERKRFTALHELGHLLWDIPAEIPAKEVENICNAFAGEMLLPADVLIGRIGSLRHDISLSELIDIQQQFGISVDDIMASLRDLGVISDRRYSGFQKKKNHLDDFRATVEMSRVEPERSGRFIRMVYRALADDVITFSKAASLLNTSVAEIRSGLQLV